MLRSARAVYAAAKQWMSTPKGRRYRHVLATVIILSALGGVAYQIAYGTDAVQWSAITLDWTWLALAIAMILISMLMGGFVWMLVLRGMGHKLSVGSCLSIHINATMAKYIPGYAWQLLGKAYLTQRQGVPARDVTLALAAELAINLLTAILVAASLLPTCGATVIPLPTWLFVSSAGASSCALLAMPKLLGIARRKLLGADTSEIDALPIWLAQAFFGVAWLVLGTSTVWAAKAISAPATGIWRPATASIALSFVASLLVFFVPAGIGIREGALTAMLDASIGAGNAAVVAVLSRLLLIIVELGCYGTLWALRALTGRHNRSITQRGENQNDDCTGPALQKPPQSPE